MRNSVLLRRQFLGRCLNRHVSDRLARLAGTIGEWSSWESYVGAGLGGAAGAEILLYTANPFLAGAGGAATSNLATQGLEWATGTRKEFDFLGLGIDITIGTLSGFIPGARIPGITAGRGSWQAVSRRIITGIRGGSISRLSMIRRGAWRTAWKMLGASLANNLYSMPGQYLAFSA